MKFSPMRTPEKVNGQIIEGCKRLNPETKPVFVVKRLSPNSRVNKCTYNVQQFLETNSGEMVLGWEVVVWNNVMLDCIGHAVVRNGSELFCVTPSKYGNDKLLFLEDIRLTFDFDDPMARMPTKYIALSNRPIIKRLIEVEEMIRSIKIRYPVSSGAIAIKGESAVQLKSLESEKQNLVPAVYLATTHHSSKCVCGSGRKFRKCCKARFENIPRHSV